MVVSISKNSSALHNLLLQSPRLFPAIPVVISFDFLLNLLHLFRLPLPFGLARLRLSAKQFIVRFSTATTQSVPPRGELPVSVVEVQVVPCVACIVWHAAPLMTKELATYSPSSTTINQPHTIPSGKKESITNANPRSW